MMFFSVILVALAAHYAFLLGSAAVGFMRVIRRRGPSAEQPTVTVVVPARNEETSIAACVESILANDYPQDRMQVIVVDDGSTDRTAELVRRFQKEAIGVGDGGLDADVVRLVQASESGTAHKKRALAAGVAQASGEIILTTDADCLVPERWISTMVSFFDPGVGMVTGAVLYNRRKNLLSELQSLEFLGLVSLGGGLVEVGRPHLCNSANLAYRREAYHDVGGYDGTEDVSTGDDEMLLHKIAYETAWQVRSCMDRDAAVGTDPNETLRDFLGQRTRWASAHARYPHRRLILTSILCYLFYLFIAGALVFFTPAMAWPIAVAFALKVGAEAAVLVPAALHFRRGALLPLLIPAQFIYIPYILGIGIAGTFGGYTWKGRRVTR